MGRMDKDTGRKKKVVGFNSAFEEDKHYIWKLNTEDDKLQLAKWLKAGLEPGKDYTIEINPVAARFPRKPKSKRFRASPEYYLIRKHAIKFNITECNAATVHKILTQPDVVEFHGIDVKTKQKKIGITPEAVRKNLKKFLSQKNTER